VPPLPVSVPPEPPAIPAAPGDPPLEPKLPPVAAPPVAGAPPVCLPPPAPELPHPVATSAHTNKHDSIDRIAHRVPVPLRLGSGKRSTNIREPSVEPPVTSAS
ncbi:MAG TPA: hypothetical protein VN962_13370, partial [Polyangia bacterium]|nr:hypothetical protein [Polyangia bacterium]